MHLHTLMLYVYDMLFHNWECTLQNMVFSSRIFDKKIGITNFHAIKNEFLCRWHLKIDGKCIYNTGQVKDAFKFSKLGVHIEKNGHLKLAHFLCRSLLNFDQIYLKMLYKRILLTITTINSTIKSMYREHFVLIVIIP